MATPPLHAAAGIVLAQAFTACGVPGGAIWAVLVTAASHPLLDFYPEYTGFKFFRRGPRGEAVWVLLEAAMFIAVAVYLWCRPSWLPVICVLVSWLPDVLEELYQRVWGEDYDRPLFFFHANNWQSFAMGPVQCGVLDAAIVTLILIGATV